MRHLNITRALIAVLAFSLALLGIQASAQATPANSGDINQLVEWAVFPICGGEVVKLCVQEFTVDYDNNGNFVEPREEDLIELSVRAFETNSGYPSLTQSVTAAGSQELDPAIAFNTKMRIIINTGDWEPSRVLHTTWRNDAFTTVKIDGHWITSLVFRSNNWSFALDCAPDDCRNPNGRREYLSYAQGVLWGDKSPTAYSAMFKGMWVSSNATGGSDPYFNIETLTWSFDTAGPARTLDDRPNIANWSAFIPDSAIIGAYGADPESMATQLSVVRTDGSTSTVQTAVIIRVTEPVPGILIDIPAYSFANAAAIPFGARTLGSGSSAFTSPTMKIKPRLKMLASPKSFVAIRAVKSAKLTSKKLAGALSYQGACLKGNSIKYAKAKSPSMVVKNLTKGTWKCRIRAVKKLGGTWSAAKSVTIK